MVKKTSAKNTFNISELQQDYKELHPEVDQSFVDTFKNLDPEILRQIRQECDEKLEKEKQKQKRISSGMPRPM